MCAATLKRNETKPADEINIFGMLYCVDLVFFFLAVRYLSTCTPIGAPCTGRIRLRLVTCALNPVLFSCFLHFSGHLPNCLTTNVDESLNSSIGSVAFVVVRRTVNLLLQLNRRSILKDRNEPRKRSPRSERTKGKTRENGTK